jgi:hypothetical protein
MGIRQYDHNKFGQQNPLNVITLGHNQKITITSFLYNNVQWAPLNGFTVRL